MDGILLVNKPFGITSHKVVEIVRKKLKVKKVGHAGTLDPLATGLLILMIGNSTKKSNDLMRNFKSYQVEMILFLETETGDVLGKEKRWEKTKIFLIEEIIENLEKFNNISYYQEPPIYSAIKINGRKLYEYARRKIEVEIPKREVFIKNIIFLDYNEKENKITFQVECSKGTYVRSLVVDIAKNLGTVASVSKLERMTIGEYSINDSKNLEDISEKDIISIRT